MATAAFAAATKDPSDKTAQAWAKAVVAAGACSLDASQVKDDVATALTTGGKKDNARRGGLMCITALCQEGGAAFSQHVIPSLGMCLDLLGDKSRNVQRAASDACDSILAIAEDGKGIPAIAMMPSLISAMQSTKFQAKVAALGTIEEWCATSSRSAVAAAMPELIPILAELLHDTKSDVADAAKDALEKVAGVVENTDIVPFIPALMSALRNPEEVIECIYKLSASVFVATVQRPELALINPLLVRGFRETRATATIRQCAKITENMSRLVEEATEAEPLLPSLIPALDGASQATSDPECRGVCAKAHTWLEKLETQVSELKALRISNEQWTEKVNECISAALNGNTSTNDNTLMVEYVAELCVGLVEQQRDNEKLWAVAMVPVLGQAVPEL
jgi:elongation factor 3